MVAAVGYLGNCSLSRTQAVHTWRRFFSVETEIRVRAAKIDEAQLSDALLALLDDAAFRAFDLLGLTEDVRADYKQLVEALSRRFASTTGEPHYVFSWDNAIKNLQRRWTSLLMPFWTLQTGHTLS